METIELSFVPDFEYIFHGGITLDGGVSLVLRRGNSLLHRHFLRSFFRVWNSSIKISTLGHHSSSRDVISQEHSILVQAGPSDFRPETIALALFAGSIRSLLRSRQLLCSRPVYLHRKMGPAKHRLDSSQPVKFKKQKVKPTLEGSGDDVLLSDIKALLTAHASGQNQELTSELSETALLPFTRFDEVEVDILELSSTG